MFCGAKCSISSSLSQIGNIALMGIHKHMPGKSFSC
jgi:hypothetical protein